MKGSEEVATTRVEIKLLSLVCPDTTTTSILPRMLPTGDSQEVPKLCRYPGIN